MWILLQKVHGYLAFLGIALCLHPWFALRRARRPSRWTRVSGYLASALIVLTNVMGWVIYPAYRDIVKNDIYRHARPVGLLFEVKEHWGWFACALAIAGAAMMWASVGPDATRLRGPVRATYLAVFLFSASVAVMGIYVSTVHGFPSLLDAWQSEVSRD